MTRRYACVARLNIAQATGAMVCMRCRSDRRWRYDGYVVGMSDRFVLIHNVLEHALLNGYTVFPLRELRSVKILTQNVLHRALQLKGEHGAIPNGIVLDDWHSLLASADAHFPLVTVHAERRYAGTCYIGRVANIKKRSVVLREINPDARWITIREPYRFKDITQVDFGGRYEAALWQVAQSESTNAGTA